MLNRIVRSVAGAAMLLVFLDSIANAQTTFFTTDTNINSTVTGDAVVGWDAAYSNATNPTVTLGTGGSIGGPLRAYNSSTVNVSGGSISGSLFANDSSTVNVANGSISGNFYATKNSTFNVSGGTNNGVFAQDNGTVNLSGGSITALTAYNSGTFNITGGIFSSPLYARDKSTLNFFGNNLTSTFNGFDTYYGLNVYTLDGTLSDGTTLNGKTVYVKEDSGAKFTLTNAPPIPEPAFYQMGALLVLGGVGVLRIRSCKVQPRKL